MYFSVSFNENWHDCVICEQIALTVLPLCDCYGLGQECTQGLLEGVVIDLDWTKLTCYEEGGPGQKRWGTGGVVWKGYFF